MHQVEHSAILSTFIRPHVPFVITIFAVSILSGSFTQVLLCNIICSRAGWFEPYLVRNPKDRFSLVGARFNLYIISATTVLPAKSDIDVMFFFKVI